MIGQEEQLNKCSSLKEIRIHYVQRLQMFSSPEHLKMNELNAIKCTEKTDKM